MTESRQALYQRAKEIIGEHTPLSADCGQLCGGACCKGDSTTGMLLFPGEETVLPTIEKEGQLLAVCQGSCKREERPLNCMLFPFFPCVNEEGKITVRPDLRGKGLCPLLDHADKIKFDRVFLRRVRRAGKLLSRDSACLDFLREVSREIHILEGLCY